jgi:Cys-rich repeat protein
MPMMARCAILFGFATLLVLACGGDAGEARGGLTCDGALARSCGNDRCDPLLGCVECLGDVDCGSGEPFCERGRCSACRTNADCGAAAPACWPGDRRCRAACTSDASCSGEDSTKICDVATGQCLQCSGDADCGGDRPLCDLFRKRCVECAGDLDCPASKPRCAIVRGRCSECQSNADCGAAKPFCDPDDFECKETGCTSDLECGGATPKCNTSRGRCVACLLDTECPATAPVCDDGRCHECKRDEHCTEAPNTRCRSNRCTPP